MNPLKNITDLFFDNPSVFHFVRKFTSNPNKIYKFVLKELDFKKNEKILDVGCGTGEFCSLIKNFYLGFDKNKNFIKYVSKKYKKYFLVSDATKLCFKNKSFHETLFLNMLHHFSDDDNKKILSQISMVTKRKLIILDLIPKTFNPFMKFSYILDRGNFIRPIDGQLKLISKYFTIKKYYYFMSGLSIHSILICSPKE